MPTDLRLDTNTHDLDLSQGSIELLTVNQLVVAQRVKIAILTKQNEWFENIHAGVPYYQEFFTKKNTKNFVDNFMIKYITQVEDVLRVSSYTSTILPSRVLRIEVSIETVGGEVFNLKVGDI
jgi:hypothetical protein